MTRLDDITGVARCAAKKNHIVDPKPSDIFDEVEERFPECAEFLRETIPGDFLYVRAKQSKRAAVKRWDDGRRTTKEVASMAGCCERTVRRARQDA